MIIREFWNAKPGGAELMAILLRQAWKLPPEGLAFITRPDHDMQLATIHHPPGHVISPHVHKKAPRPVDSACEFMFVLSGEVRVTLYGDDEVQEFTAKHGDCFLLLSGGHGFDTSRGFQAVYVKQGPYPGRDADKELITGVGRGQGTTGNAGTDQHAGQPDGARQAGDGGLGD